MKDKYKKLVKSYLNGNLGCDKMTVLQDDIKFMKQVILYCRDKNIYYKCSDNLKNNYEFLVFIIENFKNEKMFLLDVVNEYLDNNYLNFIDKSQLNIMMSQVCSDKNNCLYPYYRSYVEYADFFYNYVKYEVADIKHNNQYNEDFIDEFGLGFIYSVENFGHNSVIMEFIAKRIISDFIDGKDDIDLEKILHRKYVSFDMIDKNKSNTFWLNLLRQYDKSLADYVSCHIELLKPFTEKLNVIGKNWDNYNELVEKEKYTSMLKEVSRYYWENVSQCDFDEVRAINTAAKGLGIFDIVKKYKYPYHDILESLFLDEDHLTFLNLKHYYNIKKIMATTVLDNNDKKVKQKIIKTSNLNRSN